jgi:hypothetical protein
MPGQAGLLPPLWVSVRARPSGPLQPVRLDLPVAGTATTTCSSRGVGRSRTEAGRLACGAPLDPPVARPVARPASLAHGAFSPQPVTFAVLFSRSPCCPCAGYLGTVMRPREVGVVAAAAPASPFTPCRSVRGCGVAGTAVAAGLPSRPVRRAAPGIFIELDQRVFSGRCRRRPPSSPSAARPPGHAIAQAEKGTRPRARRLDVSRGAYVPLRGAPGAQERIPASVLSARTQRRTIEAITAATGKGWSLWPSRP